MDSAPHDSAPRTQPARTRRREDDEQGEEKQSAQSSAHVSPAMRIYRHALESIFAMLELADLSRALAVCRSWSAAVRSMKPIGGRIECDEGEGQQFRPLPSLTTLITSPLLRHLAAIHIQQDRKCGATPLTSELLALLAQHAPNLSSLWCVLTLTPAAPLIFPAHLKSLQLEIPGEPSAGEVNRVLATLAALPALGCLSFAFPTHIGGVDFGLLGASRSLTELSYRGWFSDDFLVPSDDQVVQIRSSLGHLRRIDLVGVMSSDDLARFLQPPVTARWQDIGRVWAHPHIGDLLVTLPTLTQLDLVYCEDTAHANFLSQLPLLTVLTLDCAQRAWFIPADALLASLLLCTGLTELVLDCGFNSAHWSALFAKLTKIKKLKIYNGQTEILQSFTAGPITASLEELTFDCLGIIDLPPRELSHLYALKRLRRLRLEYCFSSRLDDAMLNNLSPPTALLPALTELFHSWASRGHDVERKGPSFEWMQQRLAQ